MVQIIEAGQFLWPLTPRIVWNSREILWRFFLRELQIRYRQTVLGFVWAGLQPALAMVIFLVVFGQVAHFSTTELPYSVFALTGLVIWNYFSNCVQHGSTSLVENAELVRQTCFPRAFLPFAVITSKLIDLAVGFVVLFTWSFFIYPTSPKLEWILLPFLIFVGVIFTTGLTLFFSAVCVRFRDMRHVLPFFTQVYFFATPIVYSSSLIHPKFTWTTMVNPLAIWIDATRYIIYGAPVLNPQVCLAATVNAILIFILGSIYFRRVEPLCADVV